MIEPGKIDRLLYTFRGVVGETLSPELARGIGLVAGREMLANGHSRVLLAGDHRESTEALKAALGAGFSDARLEAIDRGMCPSPTLAFMVHASGCPGAMVTASHNPPEWNGIQLLEHDSHIIGPEREGAIKAALNQDPTLCQATEAKPLPREPADIEGHLKAILDSARQQRRLKIVADLGGGMAALAIPQLLERLGNETTVINAALDPLFLARPSEPRPEYLGDLAAAVRQQEADIGLAYDGDCDRVVVLDENGQAVEGDRVVWLLCRHLLEPCRLVLNASISLVTQQSLAEQGVRHFAGALGADVYGGDGPRPRRQVRRRAGRPSHLAQVLLARRRGGLDGARLPGPGQSR